MVFISPNEHNGKPKKSGLNWKITLASLLVVIALGSLVGEDTNSQISNENSKSEENATSVDISWIPEGFNGWSQDENVGWRWLKSSEFDCEYGDSCWGIMVISKSGCPNGLYAELSLLDKDDVQVGYTNESLSSSLPLQKSKMIFETFEDSAQTGRLAEIKCY